MTTRTSPWKPGIPCWVDLETSDVASSAAFYRSVLGWTVPEPTEGSDGVVVARKAGAAVAGLGPGADGAAPAWRVHLATDDLDLTAAAVSQAGGRLLAAPEDDGPASRTATATDPQGVRFGLWQAGSSIGSELVNEPGGLCWEELRTSDPDAARAFYGALFGYAYETPPTEAADYAVFSLPQEQLPLGAIAGQAPEDAGPARWLPFFGVTDAHAACLVAKDEGGSVLLADFPTPEGRMAKIEDPQGAQFWVVTSTGEAQPDRSG